MQLIKSALFSKQYLNGIEFLFFIVSNSKKLILKPLL